MTALPSDNPLAKAFIVLKEESFKSGGKPGSYNGRNKSAILSINTAINITTYIVQDANQ